MSDSNAIFVKIFRDKEAWQQHKDALETAKGKFESEVDYRKKLAAEAGLEESRVLSEFNNHIDPKLFYPELDYESPEYIAWRNGFSENQSLDCTEKDIENSDRSCGLPTSVLEEWSLIEKHGIFETDYFHFIRGCNSARYRCLYGIRGNKRYLVAWWGEKKYYDEIQEKLEKLRKPKEEAEARTADNKKIIGEILRGGIAGLIVAAAASLLMLVLFTTRGCERKVEKRQKSSSVSTQPLTSGENKKETPVSIDTNPNQTQKADDQKRLEEGELWASKVCVLCESETCKSVYELPKGRVYRKDTCRCNRGGTHYFLYYESDRGEGVWKYRQEHVTESVFKKIKIGDKIPFPKPEEY